MTIRTLLLYVLICLTLVGCTPGDGGGGFDGGGTRAQSCRVGDEVVAGPNQCLQDDAACYQLSNNSWCTGPRGNACPAGSIALPDNSECPRGARCFTVGESLSCVIDIQ